MPRRKNQKRYAQLCETLEGARGVLIDSKLQQKKQKVQEDSDDVVDAETSFSDEKQLRNASKSKIEAMKLTSEEPLRSSDNQMWMFAHCRQLTDLISDVFCPACHGDLSISIDSNENFGWAAKMVLACNSCSYQKTKYSSPRIENSEKENVSFEINKRMTLFTHELGKSHTALQSLSTVMGMKNMHFSTCQGHDKRLSGMYMLFLLYSFLKVKVTSVP
jgi:hypothetical protein